jgi:competence protein ComEA
VSTRSEVVVPEQSTLDHPVPPDDATRPDPAFWGEERRRRARVRVPRPAASGVGLFRERFDEWRSDARMGVALLVVVAVIAGIFWYRIGVGGGDDAPSARAVRSTATSTASDSVPSGSSGDSTSPTTTAGTGHSGGHALVVHVAGAVTHPGVVELPSGARVIDAIEAAGGGLADADLDRLNLAAKLADGQRVLVAHVGELTAPDTLSGGTGGDAGSGTASSDGLVNLNSATQAEIEALPGIGPVLAGSIIDERTRRGGFRSINELRDVRGIGEKRFADLRDKVTV